MLDHRLFLETPHTGLRITGAITPLGDLWFKHHGVIVGQYAFDGEEYVAESTPAGYSLTSKKNFIDRYSKNGPIRMTPIETVRKPAEIVKNAIQEIAQPNQNYDLISNNCESFVNRVAGDPKYSFQVIGTFFALGFLAICALQKSE